MKKVLYVLLVVLAFSSCERADLSPNSSKAPIPQLRGALYEYNIAPSATNPSIFLYNNSHFVSVDTRTTLRNKLFIFLPGTGGSPDFYRLIVRRAAALGYHAVGLMYPNGSELYSWSGSNPDNSQFGKCRQEIFDGTNQTLGVTVDGNNCIKGRLVKLLQYLATQYPSLNYQQFLNGNDLKWNQCVLAGHSQGGGHAFYIAKQVSVDKTIAFASIDWNALLGRSADWESVSGATPISKFYSFNSPRDEVFNYTNVQTQLNDMGIQGAAVSIDNSTIPYNNTRRLITNATPATLIVVPNHNVTCLDPYVPKTSRGAVTTAFTNAWNYLLTY